MKNSNSKLPYLIGGAVVLGIGASLVFSSSSKPEKIGGDTFDTGSGNTSTGGNSTPAPVPTQPSYTPPASSALNNNLVLMKGSKGNEVKALQKLLGLTADGIFGPVTEATLKAKKGVVKISLAQYNSMANINPNIYPVGSKLMAQNKNGAKVYGDRVLVNGSTESTGEVYKTVPYGEYVGIVKSKSALGNWYRVAFGETDWLGNKTYVYGWVLAVDVKNY